VGVRLVDSYSTGLDVSSAQPVTFSPGRPVRVIFIQPSSATVGDILTLELHSLDQYDNIAVTENRSVSVRASGSLTDASVPFFAETQTIFGQCIGYFTQGKAFVNLTTFTAETVTLSLFSSAPIDLVLVDIILVAFAANSAALCNLRSTVYTYDTSAPSLLTFGMDFNLGCMQLNFSETVSKQTFNFTSLILQSIDDFAPNAQILPILLNGSITDKYNDATFMTICLDNTDFNEAKKNLQLYTARSNTYLSVLGNGIRDTAGNPIVELAANQALRASYFIPDTTPPRLMTSTLNMNTGNLILSFDETVKADTLAVSRIYLSELSSLARQNLSLTGASATSSSDGPEINVAISAQDILRLKAMSTLAKSRNSLR